MISKTTQRVQNRYGADWLETRWRILGIPVFVYRIAVNVIRG